MTIHPNADEKCNGVDDNCDGAVDNGPPAQLCAGLAHANPLCTNGNCVIESCLPHYYNINGVASDGCECGEDAYEALGGQTCSNPQDLGSFADDGTEMEVVGNIIPAGDVDWLVFKAVDSPDADCDHFHVDVRFTQNEAAEYTFDVFQNGCAEASLLCGSVTELTWNTDFYVHDANKKLGECPCSTAMSPPGETPGWSVPDKHYCQDQSRTFYIKIYRNPGKPVTCTPYKLRIKNGGFI
jgi:hypothetical protein